MHKRSDPAVRSGVQSADVAWFAAAGLVIEVTMRRRAAEVGAALVNGLVLQICGCNRNASLAEYRTQHPDTVYVF